MEVTETWLQEEKTPPESPQLLWKLGSTNTRRIHIQPRERRSCSPSSPRWHWPRWGLGSIQCNPTSLNIPSHQYLSWLTAIMKCRSNNQPFWSVSQNILRLMAALISEQRLRHLSSSVSRSFYLPIHQHQQQPGGSRQTLQRGKQTVTPLHCWHNPHSCCSHK